MGFLVPGSTTRDEVTAELGEPPVVRRSGRFVAYAASRETAARMLALSIIPATFAFEERHFLFLEYDEQGVLSRSELVISPTDTTTVPACDSLGYCVLWINWEAAGLFPFWMSNGDVRHGELALLSDSSANEAAARRMEPPASGDVRATRSDGGLIDAFPIRCIDGSIHALHAEVLPTFAGRDPAVRFEEVPPDWALDAIGERRLLLE
jgi:hypothetical protein